LGQVKAKNQKEILAIQVAMEELVKVIHVLVENQPQLTQLPLDDQLSMFEDRINMVTIAIKQLYDRKLAIYYICNGETV
jgi:hypothetical protein